MIYGASPPATEGRRGTRSSGLHHNEREEDEKDGISESSGIETIELESVDVGGLNFNVTGAWQNQRYNINVWCECDGREAESESLVEGQYNPMHDWEGEPMFFDVLCEQERFKELYMAGYKAWELMPRD